MHDAAHIGPHAVDQEVHADLARNSALASHAFPLHVHNHHVGGSHSAFANAGGGDEQTCCVQPDGEIAVSGCHESAFVQAAAELHDCLPMLTVAGCGH